MRVLLTIMMLLSLSFTPAYADGLDGLRDKRVNNPLLVKILNSAKVLDLNNLPSSQKWGRQLSIRLFSIGIAGTCTPSTHMICSHSYYLAVSEFDEAPDQAVYDLGTVGEITRVEWLQDNRIDRARLLVVVSNYPNYAFTSNPSLVRKVSTYEVDVSVNSLMITLVK